MQMGHPECSAFMSMEVPEGQLEELDDFFDQDPISSLSESANAMSLDPEENSLQAFRKTSALKLI